MRLSGYFLSVALFGFALGLTTAYALDGTRSPANITPAVGRVPLDPGNLEAARILLEDAARDGNVEATWKLGRMYADGDGVSKIISVLSGISARLPILMPRRRRVPGLRCSLPKPSSKSAAII